MLAAKWLVTLRRDPRNENIIEMGLSITGWVLIAVGLTGNLLLMMGFLSFLWILVVVVISLFIALKRRRTMQQALLGVLAVSAERFIPLGPAIDAFAEDIRGTFGARLAKLSLFLKNGCPLPDALRSIKRIVPRQLLPIIRVGHESGALAEGLAEAAAAEDQQHALWGSFSAKMLYLAAVPCIGSWILFYMLVVIIGSYQRIFKDFGTALPPPTKIMMCISGWADHYWQILGFVAILFGLFFLYGILRYLGVPLFDLPGMEARCAGSIPPPSWTAWPWPWNTAARCRESFNRFPSAIPKNRSARGSTACVSNWNMAVPGTKASIATDSSGNPTWPWCNRPKGRATCPALRELAESNRRRLAYRLNVAVQLLFPPAVLCFGAAVLFIVVAMFLPLVTLIKSMS